MKTAASLWWVMVLSLLGMTAVSSPVQTAPKTEMGAIAEHDHAPASPSTSLTPSCRRCRRKTVTVHNEHTKVDESYTGVLLGDLLAKYGFPVDKTTQRKMLRSYLVAEGTDKYWVLYSVTEIEGSEHNGEVIVATNMGGKPLGDDGKFKLVDSGDKKPQRWVRNLKSITVKSAE
jgi:hypothetical protein